MQMNTFRDLEVSAHGVRLAGAGLSVREAGGHAALEDGRHQRLGRVPADARLIVTHCVCDNLFPLTKLVSDDLDKELHPILFYQQ